MTRLLTAGRRLIGLSVILGFGSSAMLTAHAGNMYLYKDDEGQVLLTNVNPSGSFNKFTDRVKVTYYPDSAQNTANSAGTTNFGTSNLNTRNNAPVSSNPKHSLYDEFIRVSANRHGVDPALLKAMMHTESAFNPNARSPVGAQGLMQLMPATARRFSVHNAWNPAENIEGAAKYVAWLNKRFNGKIEHVLAGYNAGEGNVDKYGGIPPFRETQNYVKKVLNRYNSLYKNDPALLGTSPSLVQTSSNGVNNFATSSNGYSRQQGYAQSAFDALR